MALLPAIIAHESFLIDDATNDLENQLMFRSHAS